MIEKLLIKSAIGQKLSAKDIDLIENHFRKNPELIDEYIFLKDFFKFNNTKNIDDSIFIMKNSKKIFSTTSIEYESFEDVKAASIGNPYIKLSLSLNWNLLNLDIFIDNFTNKINIKSLNDQSEIILKDSNLELFHIILAKDRTFSYSFKSQNLILTCNNKNLGLFFTT